MKLRDLFVCLAACSLAAACGRPAGPTAAAAISTRVFAAASLTAPFRALAAEFERRHPGASLELNFEGTPQLVLKVQQGAPVRVFAAADQPNMRKLVDAGFTDGAPRPFASNGLAIVAGKGNPKGITRLADLAKPDLKVALCGPEVPAGRYAREALKQAGVDVQSVSDEPNVRAVVTKVQLGEIDAGIVYRTDGHGLADRVVMVDLPAEHDVVATYPIALLGTPADGDAGEAFVAFVLAEDGQRILRSFGFGPP